MNRIIAVGIAILSCMLVFAQKVEKVNTEDLEIFGVNKKIPFSLTGDIYFVNKGITKLPNVFVKKYSIGSINTNKLDISPRKFENGFPGISNRNEWFAIDYHGFFFIKDADNYIFALESDDGSNLYINDRLIINNDGTHEPQTKYGEIYLNKGIHRMNVQYFQGPRYFIALRLLYKKEGDDNFQVFSYNDFKPVSISDFSNEQDSKVDGISIEMEGSILFDFDKAVLKQNAKLILKEIYYSFADNDTVGIVIEGHTDNLGSDEYNKKLAYNRAGSVSLFLDKEFGTKRRTWCISYGEAKPKCENSSEENRAKNRRVEIILMHKNKAKNYYMKNSTSIYRQ